MRRILLLALALLALPLRADFNAVDTGLLLNGKNLLSNGSFEAGRAGWNRYDDAASAPVDCTGGSPNASFTHTNSSSSPLAGTYSSILSKDAVNRQGHGLSYDFTLPREMLAKTVPVTFAYEPSSGFTAGSSSDVRVYVYDVTGAVIQQLAPYYLDGTSTGGPHKFTGYFQASPTSTSYRLCLHVATTSATAWTLKLDSVWAGKGTMATGPPITDWTSYTSTTGLTGGTTTHTGYWRRVGDTMEVHIDAVFTSVFTGGTATFTIPSGFTVDTTKLSSSALSGINPQLGTVMYHDVGTDSYPGYVFYHSSGTSVLARLTLDDAGTSSLYNAAANSISTTNPFTWVNNDRMTLDFKVPITGWSSGVAFTPDAIVAAKAYRSSSSTTMGTAATEAVFNTSRFDTHSAYSTSTGRFTAPIAGYYRVSYNVDIVMGATAATDTTLYVQKNGTGDFLGRSYANSLANSKTYNFSGSTIIPLVAGDYVSLWVSSTAQTVSLLHTNGSNDISSINFERVSGPSSVQPIETVEAKYSTTAGQSIPNNTSTIIDFGTRVTDSHGAVTTGATWKFTAPISGLYSVSLNILYTSGGGWGVGEVVTVEVDKNGSGVNYLCSNWQQAAHAIHVNCGGATLIRLNAGDYIDIRTLQNSGGALALNNGNGYNHVSIARIGQ